MGGERKQGKEGWEERRSKERKGRRERKQKMCTAEAERLIEACI